MRFAHLHACPDGLGACSYSGTVEVIIDDGPPIVVDIFGLGSNDANWFSARNGRQLMPQVAAAVSQHVTGSDAALDEQLSLEGFQTAIQQCWQNRHSEPAPREQTLRGFGARILHAICRQGNASVTRI